MPTTNDYDAALGGVVQPTAARNPYEDAIQKVTDNAQQRLRASVFAASQVNPDTAARARKIAERTGMAPDAVERNLPVAERQVLVEDIDQRTDAMPSLRSAYSDPYFAKVAKDDLFTLTAVERGIRQLFDPKKEVAKAPGLQALNSQEFAARVRQVKETTPGIGWDEARSIAMQGAIIDNSTGGIRPSERPEVTMLNLARGVITQITEGSARANQGLRQMAADALGIDISADVQKRAAQSEFRQFLGTPEPEGFIAQNVYGGVTSVAAQTPGLALSIATRSNLPWMASAFQQTAPAQYLNVRGRGGSPLEATMSSTLTGALEVATEFLPTKFATEGLGKMGFGEFLAGYFGRDLLGEGVNTILSNAVDTAIANPNKTWGEYFAELPEDLAATAIQTFTQAGVMGAVNTGLAKTLMADQAREYKVLRAEQHAQELQALLQVAMGSKLRERDPQTFAGFVQAAAEEAKSELATVHVDATKLGEVLKQSGVDLAAFAQMSPAAAEALPDAIQMGGSVAIPVGDLLGKMGDSGIETALLPHLRASEDALSQEEAKAEQQAAQTLLQQNSAAIVQQAADSQAVEQSVEKVRETMFAQLQATGRFSADVNRAYASMVGAFYTVLANDMGVTPEQAYAAMPLRVQGVSQRSAEDMEQRVVKLEDLPPNLQYPEYEEGAQGENGSFRTARSDAGDVERQSRGLEPVSAGGWGEIWVKPEEAAFIAKHGFGASHLNGWALHAYQLAQAGFDPALLRSSFVLEVVDNVGASRSEANAMFRRLLVNTNDTMQQDAAPSVALGGRSIPVTLGRQDAAAGFSLVPVATGVFDAAFAAADTEYSAGFYVGPGGTGAAIGDRYQRFGEFAATAESIEAPTVSVDENGKVSFGNGRHRYAFMRDQGLQSIPVAMDQESRANAERFGYVSANTNDTMQQNVTAFFKWFEGSKVVDADGKPLVVYTGTSKDADFKKFNTPGNGVWFTADPAEASAYAKDNDSRGYKWEGGRMRETNTSDRVLPVFLNLKNPMVYDVLPDRLRLADNYKKVQREVFAELKAQGYDGVIIGPPGTARTYVAFNATQIKSAIGNDGTYDVNDPSILSQAAVTNIRTGPELFPDVVNRLGLTEQEVAATALGFMTGLPGDMAFFMPAELRGMGIPEVVEFLDARRKASGLPQLDITKPEDRAQLARLVAAEALAAIKSAGASLEWYDQTIRAMLNTVALKHPELKTDMHARNVFLIATAIASQGLNPVGNLKFAQAQYDAFTKDGKFPEIGQGDASGAMAANFIKANKLMAVFTKTELAQFLVTPFTVKELSTAGFDVSGESMGTQVLGSAVFGPKIGFGFYSNLNGNFEPTTMDMWFMRTFGRLAGTLPDFSPTRYAKQLATFRAGLTERANRRGLYARDFDPAMVEAAMTDDDAALALARVVNSAHQKDFRENRDRFDRGTREKSSIVAAAATMIQSKDKPKDVPATGTERNHLRDVVAQVVDLVQQHYGRRVPPAALQALIWYPEQELYAALGVKLPVTSTDYADAARQLMQEAGFNNEDIDRAAAQSGPAGVRPTAGQRNTGANGQAGPGISGAVPLEGPARAAAIAKLQSERASAAGGRDDVFAQGATGSGSGGYSSGGSAPLEGAPAIQGATGPDPELVAVAERYAAGRGIVLRRQAVYVEADPERGARIAQAYADMKHDPQNPEVAAAYASLIAQTKDQYDALVEAGYTFTFFDGNSDPYGGNPWNAMRDLRANKHMAVYGTYDGYGTEGVTGAAIENNPMLADTGLQWPDQAGVMRAVTANDLFRAVHDAFGHGLEGAGFRAQGEENAWQAHVRLFRWPGVQAITSETRGQNSWLNFNGALLRDLVGDARAEELHPDNWQTINVGEHNQTAKVEDTIFADQKTGLMPLWTLTEGRAPDMVGANEVAELVNQRKLRQAVDLRLLQVGLVGAGKTGLELQAVEKNDIIAARLADDGINSREDLWRRWADAMAVTAGADPSLSALTDTQPNSQRARKLVETHAADAAKTGIESVLRKYGKNGLDEDGMVAARYMRDILKKAGIKPTMENAVQAYNALANPREQAANDALAQSDVVKPGQIDLIGVHFSTQQGLQYLNGQYYGTGLKGAERERVRNSADSRLASRTYFYVNEGSGVRPEAGVGGNAHEARITNLYDINADPLKLIVGGDINATETNILNAGFSGYYVRNAFNQQGAAVVIGDASRAIPVTPIANPTTAAPPLPATPQVYRRGLMSSELNKIDIDAIKTVAPSARITAGTFQVLESERAAAAAVAATQGIDLPVRYSQGKGTRGTYSPKSLTITLLENADLSTFLHETGHFMLEAMASVANSAEAPVRVREDMATLLKWFGVPDLQTWLAMDTNGKRPYHEKFAESFEQYLFEGKAPSKELQPLFQRFAAWFERVYQSLQQFMGSHNTQLTDEVRAVFDRMLATREQIAQKQEEMAYTAMFTARPTGMTDDEYVEWMMANQMATGSAEDELRARSLRDLRWVLNARARELVKLRKGVAEKRKVIEDEVRKEVAAVPVYAVQRWIKTGMLPDGTQQTGARLNTEDLRDIFGDSPAAPWRYLATNLISASREDSLHPDEIAEMFGFPSGDQMVREIVGAYPEAQTIDGMTDNRVLERHGDIASQRAMDDAANEAVHNEYRAKVLASELKAMTQATQPVRLMLSAAKSFASQLIGRRKVKDIKPFEHERAEERAAKRGAQATAKGELAEATAAKRDQVLQFHAAKAAREALAEVKLARELFNKIVTGKDDVIGKTRDMDLVNATRAILANYGFGGKAKTAHDYLMILKDHDPVMFDTIYDRVIMAEQSGKPFSELTMDELRALVDEVKSFWLLAKRTKQIEIDGKLVDLEEAQAALSERIDVLGIPLRAPGEGQAVTPAEKRLNKLQSFIAAATRVESWITAKDGGPTGVFRKYIYNTIKDAADSYRADRAVYAARYTKLLATVGDTLKRGTIAAPELRYTFGKGEGGIGMSELLHAILHTGNESNKRKLLLGRKWATENADGTLDTTKWDTFVQRMIDEGKLQKKHFDFAQGVWDMLESTKGQAQKMHRDVFGRYFAEVTADGFTNQFGNYRGGYVPAMADPGIVSDAKTRALAEEENQSLAFAFPTTNKGFTKSRVEYNRPLMLDLRTLSSHLDKVLMFSHLEGPVRDVRRLLTGKGVAYALNRQDPVAFDSILTPWLNRTARQIVETPVAGDAGLMRFFSVVRNNAGMAAMFANVTNAAQQITGFSVAATQVPPRLLMSAMASYLAAPGNVKLAVKEASPYMAGRMENEVAAMHDAMRDILLDPNVYDKAKAWSRKHAYFLQSAADNIISPMVWLAAHNHALEQNMPATDARRHADSVVRTTQGSTLPEDVSRIETGNAFVRMFTQFMGYFNMQANLLGAGFVNINRDLGLRNGAGKALGLLFLGALAPAWVAEAIAQGMKGGPDDEDDDGWYLDDWIKAVFGYGTIRTATAMVPVAGQIINAAVNATNSKPYDDRIGSTPAISMIESTVRAPISVYKAMVDDASPQKAVRDTATALSMITGIPVSGAARPLGYLAGVAAGDIEPEGRFGSEADMVRGLITGTASPESKE